MDKVFFKIVVPNYNNMAYIKECFDSILNQTFQDFKIIVVDDISTDMSDKFIQMYARKYPDKIVFLQVPEKKYAGGCRNAGIDYPLDCEYYMFVDADDYLARKDVLEKIKNELAQDVDVLLLDYFIKNGSNLIDMYKIRKYTFNVKSDTLANTLWNSSWSKVIRKKFIKHFLEGCMRGEDTYQWLQILDMHPYVKQSDICAYVYRQNEKSATHTSIFKEHRSIFIDALNELQKKMHDPYVIASINRRLGK